MGVSCAQCILAVSSPKDWCNERLCYLLFRFYFSWACAFQEWISATCTPKLFKAKKPPNFCMNLLNNKNSIMCSLHTQRSASNEELITWKPEVPTILKLEWPSSLSSSTDTPGHIIRTLSTFLKRLSLDLFVFLWFCNCCLSELSIPHSKVCGLYVVFSEEGIRNLYLLYQTHKLKLSSKCLLVPINKLYSPR